MMLLALALAAPVQFTPTHKEAIKAAVGANLKDPFSAQYEWQPVRSSTTYCGWVNAKNSFGAYDGYRLFMVLYYIGLKTKQLKVIQTEMDPAIAAQMCYESGYRTARE